MAVQCVVADSHLSGTVPNAPSTGESISIVTWMSGTWSTAIRSFVGVYGPTAVAPTTAIQIGSRTGAGACSVWTWNAGQLVNTPTGVLVDNVTHFIAYTFDGTTHRLYVDGVQQGTSVAAQNAGQFNVLYISGYPTGVANETSNHIIESIGIYDRVLSANEVLTMFASKGARHNILNGLLAYYELDEGPAGSTTSTCIDLSGNGGALTWTGAGATMTYTYSSGEAKLRPVAVN